MANSPTLTRPPRLARLRRSTRARARAIATGGVAGARRAGRAVRARARLLLAFALIVAGASTVLAGAAILGPVAIAIALIVGGVLMTALGLVAVDVAPRARRRR